MSINKLSWIFEDQREFLENGYLEQEETPEQRYQTIANTVQSIVDKLSKRESCKEYEKVRLIGKRFENYFEKGWVSLATPVLKNFGSPDNLPISCNKSILSDSLDDITKGINELSMLAKYGAGTSQNFSKIRPINSNISTGGNSNSVMDWIELYADMMSKTAQNRARRGFLTAYLSADHEEIMEFLDIGTHRIPKIKQRFFNTITTGVTLPIGWRDDLKSNPKKREVFTKILNTRKEIGYPYITDLTNINNSRPQVYKDKGMFIETSNICVTGDQRVVTNNGYIKAIELWEEGKELTLFNNESPVKSSEMRLIEKDAEVYEIKLKNGMSHKVTPYHKVKVYRGSKKYETIACKDLILGDKVCIQTNKGLFGNLNMEDEAFMLGMWQSDGTNSGNTISLCLWENDFDIIQPMQDIHNRLLSKYKDTYSRRYKNKGEEFIESATNTGNKVAKKALNSSLYSSVLGFSKGTVPDWVWKSTELTQWSYVKGLLIADGTVFKSKKTEKLKNEVIQLSYTDINKKFLEELQLIFNNLGLSSCIYQSQKERYTALPDGKGGVKEYLCKAAYKLVVGNLNDCLTIDKNTGFLSRKDIHIEDKLYRDNTKKSYEVVALNKVSNEDVYCVTIPTKNKFWVCNGILTHNCNETAEYADENKTFACCLSSVNLYYYDDFKNNEDFIFDMNILLDCVIEEYIEKGKNMPGLEKAVLFAKEHRSVGLGVTAFMTYLQKNSIAVGSLESFSKNYEIFNKLKVESDKASQWMAKNWGEPEIMKGYGFRNTTRLAQAPKKSTTFIDGGTELSLSEGIEPHLTNYGEKKLAKIQVTFKNRELEKVIKAYGKDSKDIWESIRDNNGSVQHLDFLSEHEKDVFKTFSEVSQADIIKLAASRAPLIDQGQSVNIMIHPDTPAKDLISLHLMAFDEGLKGLYYQHSINAAQKFSQEQLVCTACEG